MCELRLPSQHSEKERRFLRRWVIWDQDGQGKVWVTKCTVQLKGMQEVLHGSCKEERRIRDPAGQNSL